MPAPNTPEEETAAILTTLELFSKAPVATSRRVLQNAARIVSRRVAAEAGDTDRRRQAEGLEDHEITAIRRLYRLTGDAKGTGELFNVTPYIARRIATGKILAASGVSDLSGDGAKNPSPSKDPGPEGKKLKPAGTRTCTKRTPGPTGEPHGRRGAKLTVDEVHEIRQSYKGRLCARRLGRQFRVKPETIRLVVQRKTWQDLPRKPGDWDAASKASHSPAS